jgi:hypothetical protein
MDYETKLYLDKVIETIEKLDSPDWWTIGITSVLTIINIGAFVFVAWTQIKIQKHQTKLQEQQTKAQEYEVYRNLYRIVKRANSSIDSFLDDLWTALWDDTYKFTPDYYKKRRQEILSLNDEFEINAIDFKLKFSKEFFDTNLYQEVLKLMVDVYQTIDIQSNPQLNSIELVSGMQRVFDREVEKDKELAGAISRCFTSEWCKNQIHRILMRFIELKEGVINEELLNKIEHHCNID